MNEPREGDLISNRFRIRRVLGEGGMGIVYEAFDFELKRAVALKILRQSSASLEDVKRMERESRALASLDDPSVVFAFKTGQWCGQPYIVMELVSGESLQKVTDEEGPWSWRDACSLIVQLSRALRSVHDAGIIHRDIKPANIMLQGRPPCCSLKLIDFGLCRISQSQSTDTNTLTETGSLLGSFFYMSPEACAGEPIGPPADVYAVGCTMYFMLTGRPPFVADEIIGVLHHHRTKKPDSLRKANSSIDPPAELEDLILAMLNKDASSRPSINAVRERVESVLSQDAPVLLSKKKRRRPPIALLSGAGCVFIFLLLIPLLLTEKCVMLEEQVFSQILPGARFCEFLSATHALLRRGGRNSLCGALTHAALTNNYGRYSTNERLMVYKTVMHLCCSDEDFSAAKSAAFFLLKELVKPASNGLDIEMVEAVLAECSALFVTMQPTPTDAAELKQLVNKLGAMHRQNRKCDVYLDALLYLCLSKAGRELSPSDCQIGRSAIDRLNMFISENRNVDALSAPVEKSFETAIAFHSLFKERREELEELIDYCFWMIAAKRDDRAREILSRLSGPACSTAFRYYFSRRENWLRNRYRPEEVSRIESFLSLLPAEKTRYIERAKAGADLAGVFESFNKARDHVSFNSTKAEEYSCKYEALTKDALLGDTESSAVCIAVDQISNWSALSARTISSLEKLLLRCQKKVLLEHKESLLTSLIKASDALISAGDATSKVELESFANLELLFRAIGESQVCRQLLLQRAYTLWHENKTESAMDDLNHMVSNRSSFFRPYSKQLKEVSGNRYGFFSSVLSKLITAGEDEACKLVAASILRDSGSHQAKHVIAAQDNCVNVAIQFFINRITGSKPCPQLRQSLANLRSNGALSERTLLNLYRLISKILSTENQTNDDRLAFLEAQRAIIQYGPANAVDRATIRQIDDAFTTSIKMTRELRLPEQEALTRCQYCAWLMSFGKIEDAQKQLQMVNPEQYPTVQFHYEVTRANLHFCSADFRDVVKHNPLRHSYTVNQAWNMYSWYLYTALQVAKSKARCGVQSTEFSVVKDSFKQRKDREVLWFPIEATESIYCTESGRPEDGLKLAWSLTPSMGQMYASSLANLKLGNYAKVLTTLPDACHYEFNTVTAGLELDFLLMWAQASIASGQQARTEGVLVDQLHLYKNQRDTFGSKGYPDPDILQSSYRLLYKQDELHHSAKLQESSALLKDIMRGIGLPLSGTSLIRDDKKR